MTTEQEQEHRLRRRKIAYGIMYSAHEYKVCDQCLNLTHKRRGVCEACGAYSWDDSRERIFEVAHLMAKQLFPLTLGYAQRNQA